MRTVDELIASGLAVIDRAYIAGAYSMRPLFSGGHDSLCACHIASQHKAFRGEVHHIDTGIGAKYTREFVERVCEKYGWKLRVYKSHATYEQRVREFGFPGPGMHQTTYNRIKERCVYKICRGCRAWKNAAMLVTGCRSQESVRRMGHVEPIKIGETSPATGKRRNLNRVWTAPCHDWSKADQQHYMDEMGLPVNKLKIALGMSGECFCGAFASPGELERIRQFAPDVAAEIDRLTEIAKAAGKPCVWGQRPACAVTVESTGELCSACDQRAASAGIVVLPTRPAAIAPAAGQTQGEA